MEDQTDELRARFTVFIKQLIIHAKISYLRQLKKASIDISFEEMENILVQDFDDQYKEFTKERMSFDFEEDTLAKAFASLPLMKKRILKLTFLYDYSPTEIAQILHCPKKYVYDQKYLAMKKIEKLMEENHDDQR